VFSFNYLRRAPKHSLALGHSHHFYIEFYPPYRERDKLKFYVSVENGARTITYDPELLKHIDRNQISVSRAKVTMVGGM